MKLKLIILSLFFFIANLSFSNNNLIDSLKNKLKIAKQTNRSGKVIIAILNELAQESTSKSPIEALNYCFEAIEYSIRIRDDKEIFQVYGTLGNIYQEQGLFDQAMEFNTKSLMYFEAMNDPKASAWSLVNIGNIYYAKTDFDKAALHYKKALEFFNQDNDEFGKATVFNNLGMIFNKKKECDSSLFYFNKALEIRNRQGELNTIALSYRYIGNAYKTCKNFEKSRYFLKKAFMMYEKASEMNGAAQLLLFIGDLEFDYFDAEDALKNYENAAQIYEQQGNNSGLAEALNRMSKVHVSLRNYQTSIDYANKSLEKSIPNGLLLEQQNSYYYLYNSYSKMGKYKYAFDYLTNFNLIKDSVSNEKVTQRFLQQEFILLGREHEKELQILAKDNEIQVKEIQLLEKNKQIQQLILKKRNNLIYYFILTTIVLLVLVFTNLRTFQNKVKLIKEFSFGASLMSKTGVVFLTGLYFTAFVFLFQPFGLDSLSDIDKTIVFGGFGLISMLIIFISFLIFNILERFVVNEKWDVLKYILFICIIIFGISFSAWWYAKIYKIDELGFMTWFDILIVVLSLSIIPLFIIVVFIEKIHLKKQAKITEVLSHHLKHIEKPLEDHLITLKSDKSKEELSFLLSEFICAEAKGNYSEINYLQGDKQKKTMMLISMKMIEEQLQNFETIIRCHKSFIVNSSKILKLTGNSQGYKLIVKHLENRIPVSRNFPKENLEKLKSN
ncbi:MAG: tetratricopeptide repeat protein [Bacteroidales bacterium]|nr:tetratricopeptide repeat protein [Bacteroidales bacterium]